MPEKYIKEIINLAEDSTTSSMSSARIAAIINNKLSKDGIEMTIHKASICRILNKELGSPRKTQRVFFLSEKQKIERLKFCESMLEKRIRGEEIFFTD